MTKWNRAAVMDAFVRTFITAFVKGIRDGLREQNARPRGEPRLTRGRRNTANPNGHSAQFRERWRRRA